MLIIFIVQRWTLKKPTAMKTSLSVGIPTGSQPLVARLRLTLFCLVLLRLGTDGDSFVDSFARPTDRESPEGLVLFGHSLASFSLAWGWSRPDRWFSRWGLVCVEVGTLDRGQLDMGMVGGTRREGL